MRDSEGLRPRDRDGIGLVTTPLLPVLDVGGTHVTAALVDLDALQTARRVTRPLDAHGSAVEIIGSITGAASALGADRADLWGIAMPGPFDYAAGRGTFAGVEKFAAIAGLDLRAELSPDLGVSPEQIRFLNDADAYALGEWDAQSRPSRLMCATLGTGVGGGFIEDGRIVTEDARVPAGGDFYHLKWCDLPLEHYVSRRAFIREYGDPGLDVKEIAERAAAGDTRAEDVFARGMGVLARVLGPWVDAFAPDVFIVGGAIARSWSVVGPALRSALGEVAVHSPDVHPSRLDEHAPLIGAAEFARSNATETERNFA